MRVGAAALILLIVAASAMAESQPEAELRKEAGNQFLKEREYEKARDQYLAALKADPGYSDAHYNLGVVYFFRLQDYPRALYHFVEYARLNPEASDMPQVRALVAQAVERIEAAEREAYGRALDEGTLEAIEAFLEVHPVSPYAEDAQEKIRLLKEYDDQVRRRERAIETAYQEAFTKGSPEEMDAFLQRYPDAPQAAEARQLRDRWLQERTEGQEAFEAAIGAGSTEALEAFLADYPDSSLVPEARDRLEHLESAEEAFRIASESHSIPALEVFLTTFADTPREAEARQLLETLRKEDPGREAREEAERQAEEEAAARAQEEADRDWATAEAAHTAEAYTTFLTNRPDHPMAEEARRRAAVLREAEEASQARAVLAPVPEPEPIPESTPEETLARDWAEAQSIDTEEAYAEFLLAHPDGDEAEAARARLEELETTEGIGELLPRSKRNALDRYRKMLEGQ